MQCPHCGRETAEQASFCNYCGERIAVACQSCESLNPPDSRYCSACGHDLTVEAPPKEPAVAPARQTTAVGAACPRCGASNEPASTYCFQCGLPLENQLRPTGAGASGSAYAGYYRSAGKRANWTVALLVATGVVAVISFFSTIAEINLLERVTAGENVAEAELLDNDDRQAFVVGTYIIVLIATVIAFSMWIHRASANLPPLGSFGQRFSPGWAVGWWFVPIMSLFRPYQVVKEIWKGSGSFETTEAASNWTLAEASPVLAWWWAVWLVSNFLGNVAFRSVFRGDAPEDLITADRIGLAADATTLAAAVLAIIVVRKIANRQDRKHLSILTG